MAADLQALAVAFQKRFGCHPRWLSVAPGRVNLIGEHTDYNQGHVLPIAIDRSVTVAATPNDKATVRAFSLDFAEDDTFSLEAIDRSPRGGWRNYVRGMAAVLQQAGYALPGLDIAITGDVPIAAGLSSSAALEVAVLGTFQAAGGLDIPPKTAALLAQQAENEFVGVACGVMDQLAANLGCHDHALLIDCRSLETEAIPLCLGGQGVSIVVVDSAVRRALEDSPYNLRRQECAQAARLLGVEALRDVAEADLEAQRCALPETLYRRARHVVGEEARVLAAVEALRRADLTALGGLLYQSHRSLQDDFQVSCPELDLLVELAAEVEGVLGARLTGAGFGGCTVNLVRQEALDAFRRRVVEKYRSLTGLPAEMHTCRAAAGLRVSRV